MMNPTAMPPAYAYFYGGSAAMIPGNFQYGAPTIYPVYTCICGLIRVCSFHTYLFSLQNLISQKSRVDIKDWKNTLRFFD